MIRGEKTLFEMENENKNVLYDEVVNREIFYELPNRAYDFAILMHSNAKSGVKQGNLRPSDLASRFILNRMQQDTRCCFHLAIMGYGSSSAALASSVYEGFYYLSEIENNDLLAEKWLLHGAGEVQPSIQEMKNHPQKLAQSRERFYKAVTDESFPEIAAMAIEDSRAIYAQLCAFKHINPAVVSRTGYKILPEPGQLSDTLLMSAAPFLESQNLFISAYSVMQASHYLMKAATRYGIFHSSMNSEEVEKIYAENLEYLKKAYRSFEKFHNIEYD